MWEAKPKTICIWICQGNKIYGMFGLRYVQQCFQLEIHAICNKSSKKQRIFFFLQGIQSLRAYTHSESYCIYNVIIYYMYYGCLLCHHHRGDMRVGIARGVINAVDCLHKVPHFSCTGLTLTKRNYSNTIRFLK